MDFGTILSSLPEIISLLPLLLEVTQIIFLMFFLWFFGSMAMKGFVARKPFTIGIGGTLLAGSLCLVASASLAGFIPFFDNILFKLMNVDMMVAGIIVSALLALALYLITKKSAEKKPPLLIKELKRKIVVLEDMLRRHAHHLKEKEIKKIAEGALKGYKVVHSKFIGSEFDVDMQKEKKTAKLIIDAWDGEIKQRIMSDSAFIRFFHDPMRIAGLAIIVILIVASAIFFEGFPSPGEEMASLFGISLDELGDMASSLGDNPLLGGSMPDNCISMLVFTQYYEQFRDQDFVLDHVLVDEQMSRIIEDNCGLPLFMVKIDHSGRDLIIAVTENSRVGYVTDTTFCSCIDTLSG